MNIRLGPSGVHLFDRATGQNLLLDEARVPSEAWHRAPRQISIALTNACDLLCSYCYAPKTAATLDFSQVVTWIDELSTSGCLGVGFGGGEPTLYKRLLDLCRYAAARTKMAVTFTTHGHHLDNDLIEGLQGNVHFIRVSMDGVRKTYELLRGRPFAALILRLRAVKTLCPFGINFVVNSNTISELGDAIEIASDEGASEFLLLPEQKTPHANGISDRATKELCSWVNNYRGRVRLAISETSADGFPTCNPFAEEAGLRAYAHVDASGVLKKCSYDKDGVTIGEGGILVALESLRRGCEEDES